MLKRENGCQLDVFFSNDVSKSSPISRFLIEMEIGITRALRLRRVENTEIEV